MKICFVSYEFEPFPGGGIATYHNAAVRQLAEAGHEVHVVTNRAWHGRTEPHLTQRLWKDGNLTIHRLYYFDDRREPPADAQFFDVNTADYGDRAKLWARDPSNLAAHQAAGYVEALHTEVGLDVIEAPEFFAEAFYVLRRRRSGQGWAFPPVCIHGHISSRFAFGANRHTWELGYLPHRHLMLREEYCVRNADALITPSRALMKRYEESFPGRLPEVREVIPYFLELPEEVGALPSGLDAGTPFLVVVGRIEPRKGSDLAMRAFSMLADEQPDLQLVLLGKEMWHAGESVDDVVAACVPAQHRARVRRLGNVPRERALAAAQGAVAFLHPAPWDNYPCAVLEAMAVGAACVVSDQGGQSEMVEDGRSGLVFPAGDAAALADAVRRVLADKALADGLRSAARERVRALTEPKALIERKMAVFSAMVEKEKRDQAGSAGAFRIPPFLRPHDEVPPLAAKGVVVLDAGSAARGSVETTATSMWNEVRSSEGWELTALVDPGQSLDLPSPWTTRTTLDDPAWVGLPDDGVVVFVAAGTRVDLGALGPLVAQLHGSMGPCGSFLWLRPAGAGVFPYASDFSHQDLLVEGHPIPPVFAVRAVHLRRCASLSGLFRPEQRLCALLAAAAAAGDMMFQHTGEVCGDFYGDLPLVTNDVQLRATGYLDVLGLLPAAITTFGCMHVPRAPTADQENAAPQPAAPQPAVATGDNHRYRELEDVYRQHMALKQMAVVRWLRKLGAFGLARRLFPKSEKLIGRG